MFDDKIIINKKSSRPKRLGMGLSALLGDIEEKMFPELEEDSKKNSTPKGYTIISIFDIVTNTAQPRKFFSNNELNELANSIKENGILQPILVRSIEGGKFQIIAGERRFRASKLVNLKEIPCVIKEVSGSEVFLIALLENIQREDLNPLEEAEGYAKLISDFNYTQEQISKIVHKSRSHIANLIRLIKLPEKVKHMVKDGRLTSGHVRPLLALNSEEQIISVAEVIYENSYSARKVEELVNLILNDEEMDLGEIKSQISKPKSKMEYSHSELISEIIEAFNVKFGAQINIKSSKKGGTISIKYKTERELKSIMSKIIE